MKKITLLGISLLMMIAVAFTPASVQQEKDTKKKEQSRNKDKADKTKPDKNKHDHPADQKHEHDKKDNGQPAGKKDKKDKNDKSADKDKKDKDNGNLDKENDKEHGNGKHDYKWDRETFKNRKEIRNGEKVTLCHKFNNAEEPAVTINVSSNALKAHMAHGDVMGSCPQVADSRYSEDYLRKRNNYYNILQNSYDQVVYSRSILDYALDRLANARQQLVIMQTNKAPVPDIERRQAIVIELEQNVSALEALLGTAAAVAVINKLQ